MQISKSFFVFVLTLVFCVSCNNQVSGLQDGSWDGEWQSFWRNGGFATVNLEQDGEKVTGTYAPGAGTINGTVEGNILNAEWRQEGSQGTLVFAMSEDGQSFAGRFGNGEYWNGLRSSSAPAPVPFDSDATPRAALQTLLAASNASNGSAAYADVWLPLLTYLGEETSAYDRRLRRDSLLSLFEISTFRLQDVPLAEDAETASFTFGPINSDARTQIQFSRNEEGRWRIEVPTLIELQSARAQLLSALDFETLGEFRKVWSTGPRQTMQSFITGINDWNGNGRQQAIEALDLSAYTPTIQTIEGPLAADFLRRTIDRVGYIIWQEIPNDPNHPQPYLLYENVGGLVEIAPIDIETETLVGEMVVTETETKWLFSAATVESAAEVYKGIQALPIAEGLSPSAPLSGYFAFRGEVEKVSPALLNSTLGLENWQWLALALIVVLAFLASMLVSEILSRILRRIVAAAGAPEEAVDFARDKFLLPLRILTVSAILFFAVRELGLRADYSQVLGSASMGLLVIGLGLLAHSLATTAASWISNRDRPSGFRMGLDNDIVVLVSGLAKIVIWVSVVFALADLLGLPYEGVIAGLGVGGLALAIAARDTVANFISATTILFDRPFRRGDLVEINGIMATIEETGLRATRMRTPEDSLLVVPNSQLTDNQVNNWGMRRNRRLLLQIGLTYDTPREKLDAFVKSLEEVYANHPQASGVRYIGLKTFGPSSIDIEFSGFFQAATYEAYIEAQHRLIGDIIEAASRDGVEFAFPTRTLHVAQSDLIAPEPQS